MALSTPSSLRALGLAVALALLAACSGDHRAPIEARPAAVPTTSTSTTTSVAASSTSSTVPTPPYAVTELTVRLVDTTRPTVSHGRTVSPTRALTTLVWVPKPAGRRPLIVFAHGFQVGPAPYRSFLESWAAQGYVVAAPEFPLTDQAVAGANLDEADINSQPADVRFVTDRLVAEQSPVRAWIDASRVAVAGHSDGAETALAAATVPPPSGQPRYRAVIVFGVQPVPGAAGRNPPILIGQGDADTINPPSYGAATFADAGSPKYFLGFRGGGHLPPLEAGSAWLAGIESVSEAFLDCYVAGDRPVSAIASAAVPYPKLSLRSG